MYLVSVLTIMEYNTDKRVLCVNKRYFTRFFTDGHGLHCIFYSFILSGMNGKCLSRRNGKKYKQKVVQMSGNFPLNRTRTGPLHYSVKNSTYYCKSTYVLFLYCLLFFNCYYINHNNYSLINKLFNTSQMYKDEYNKYHNHQHALKAQSKHYNLFSPNDSRLKSVFFLNATKKCFIDS